MRPNIKVHFIYACAIIISTILIIAYFVWYQYQAKTIELDKQQHALLESKEKKRKQFECISNATVLYHNQWSRNCKTISQNSENLMNNCVKEATAYVHYMSNILSKEQAKNLLELKKARCYALAIKFSPDCSLPVNIAKALNTELGNMQNECFKIYS